MTNPINPLGRNTNSSISNNTNKAQANHGSEGNAASSNAAASEDKVSLSQQSQQVSGLQQELKSAPEIDSAKVDSIKQEIANGNYPLDPEKIAENLINLEQALLE